MDNQKMEELATLVAGKVLTALGANATVAAPARMKRLTVAQFAFCAQRSEEHIRRKIRARIIPRTLWEGPPYLIDPKAFEKFGVSPEIAISRLPLFQESALPSDPSSTSQQSVA